MKRSLGRIAMHGLLSLLILILVGCGNSAPAPPTALPHYTAFGYSTVETTPEAITAGPDGTLWFTALPHMIGRIIPEGRITKFVVPSGCQPGGIAAGPDGALWFTEGDCDKIGRITPGTSEASFNT